MVEKKEVDFIYLLLYHKIKEKAAGKNYIEHSSVMEILRNNLYHVRKQGHYIIIKEMQDKYGLLRRVDKKKIEIVGGNRNLQLAKYEYPLW